MFKTEFNFVDEVMTSVMKNYKNNAKKMNIANYSESMKMLTTQANNVVRDLDPTNDLMVLRIGTKKRKELLVSSSIYIFIFIENLICILYNFTYIFRNSFPLKSQLFLEFYFI